ncbi:MAG TPA: gamma carbonic anhydrase family protein [Stellaceae bacterium]|jgi:carbonic anhydrase/acetyltransferase-like protein (isoleucine patch superfamily)|nr:gamma carbonic anhydrase family protein [Stellaceae bacterium]
MAQILPYRGILPRISPDAFIAENAVIIGDVEIGAGSGIWYNCVLRGDVHQIRIGARVNIQDGTVVHVAKDRFPTIIGDDVSIGHMALIHACTLEPFSFVGMQATVMDGAVVESRAMVAAGALVPPGKRVPAGEIWAGNPAKLLRKLTDKDYDRFTWTVKQYASLAEEYRAQQGSL